LTRQREPGALRVDFRGQPHGDAGLCAFADRLKVCKQLVRIDVRCSACDHITDKAIVALCTALHKHVETLEEIGLDVALCDRVADDAVEALAELFVSLAAVSERAEGASEKDKAEPETDKDKTVRLPGSVPEKDRLADSKKGKKAKNKSKEDHAPIENGLRRFDLNFHGCRYMSDRALTLLGDSMAKLNAVRAARISLAMLGPSVTVQSLRTVCLGFTNMEELEQVVLDCHGGVAFSETALINLTQALSGKDKLKSLMLNFHGCTDISSSRLVSFQEPFKQCAALQAVCMNFTLCPRIDSKGIEDVCEFLKKHANLKKLVFHVGGTQVTQDAIALLTEDMKHIEQFRISTAVRAATTFGVTVAGLEN